MYTPYLYAYTSTHTPKHPHTPPHRHIFFSAGLESSCRVVKAVTEVSAEKWKFLTFQQVIRPSHTFSLHIRFE